VSVEDLASLQRDTLSLSALTLKTALIGAIRDSGATVLAPGMVFHVPQTLRLEGEIPLAISETVLIGESGPEILTNFKPRDLVVV